MHSTDHFNHRYQKATINMIDGEMLEGTLLGFSPIMRTLHFIDDSCIDLSHKLDTLEIAYIALHRTEENQRCRTVKTEEMDELNIVTVNIELFEVYAAPTMSNTPGFYCYPKSDEHPYERIFFYHHGIRLQEKPQRLGELLLDQEMLESEDLSRALAVQTASIPALAELLLEQGALTDEELATIMATHHPSMGELLLDQESIQSSSIYKGTSVDLPPRSRDLPLGHALIEAGLITAEELHHSLDEQKRRARRLGEILLDEEIITEDELLSILAKKFRLPQIDLDHCDTSHEACMLLGREYIQQHKVLPIEIDRNTLKLAISSPLGLDEYNAICFRTGKKVREILVKDSQLLTHIEMFLSDCEASEAVAYDFVHRELTDEEPVTKIENMLSVENTPVVRLVSRLIRNGLKRHASDIHILPLAKKVSVSYRLNGQLLSQVALEKGIHKQVTARIKILSGMDIAEQRLPQDGRMMLREENHTYEFRVSSIPNAFGESIVLRVLNKGVAVNLESLGLREDDLHHLTAMAHKLFGLILVTGPTGSGKSTTLFSILKSISHLPAHILTIEDPIESEIAGANQIQVNHKIGMSFSRILRNALRHDPDIIMIGEMRDEETAKIGIEAALTGHLIYSTLHTNSAVDAIIRLNDLGIPNYLIAPALRGVISQNLLKTLCPQCRQPVPDDDEVFAIIQDQGLPRPNMLYKAIGCEHCSQTGFIGRVMLYEFLVVNDAMRHAIHDGKGSHQLKKIAVAAGMRPKSEYALQLAADGTIDHNDFISVLM
ncbi:hypothetical protein FE236_08465 [Mariprofundus erugo]|uniref:GspE/PulE family protein n=1 Tax=Mariprofundus erugo TaxID=2528639 RepID=UPI0010FF5369|nr:GspE/PulE family protein [Mariprofundus erugo]TLS75771.1 hypothetical protein FE236_08465 [Mariprofundus erugo]